MREERTIVVDTDKLNRQLEAAVMGTGPRTPAEEEYPPPNRHQRRANKAKTRGFVKKMKKGKKEIMNLLAQAGVDPSKIQVATEEDIKKFKAGEDLPEK